MIIAKWVSIALLALVLNTSLPAQEPTARGLSRTDALQKLRQARAAAMSGENEKARQLITEARTWGESRQDRLVVAWAAQVAGELAFSAKEPEKATTEFTAALAAFTDAQDKSGMANARLNLGRLALAAGNPAEAAKHLQVALELFEKLHRPSDVATSLKDLAAALKTQNQYAEAKTTLQKALELYRAAIKDPTSEVQVLCDLAECHEMSDAPDTALQHLNTALSKSSEVKDPALEARVHGMFGRLSHKKGAFDDAARHYKKSLDCYATTPQSEAAIAATRNNLGAILLEQGKSKEALEELTKAADAQSRLSDTAGQARTLYNIALAHEAMGQEPKAIEAYEKALALRRQLKDSVGTARVLDNLSLLYAAQGKTDQAKTAREEAELLRKK